MRSQRLLWGLITASLSGGALAQAPCINETITPSFEERRLVNLLPGTTVPAPQRILEASGSDKFGPGLIAKLCAEDAPSNLTSAMAVTKGEARRLWRGAVDRAQGKHVEGDLPRSDDRPLYWARLTMTKALRQWQPSFEMSPEERAKLIWEFERTSRGQYDIDFPAGHKNIRVLVSGFDPFSLGNPGSTGTGVRIGNPSGANALSLDGQRIKLPNGTTAAVETYILPVNYTEFMAGMVEDTVAPHMQPGPKRVDASISVSQGGAFEFWLEHWNGRFHGPSAGNDGIALCPSANGQRLPANDDCDVYPPERWLGYNPKPWSKHNPPQFTVTTMPVASMIAAKTGTPGGSFQRPPGDGWNNPNDPAEVFGVFWHTNYGVFPDCNLTQTVNRNNPVPLAFPPPTPPIPPGSEECARSGGGGDYLSNEVAYRNTLMRDTFGLKIPAGHIHVPTMTRFIGNTPPNNSNTSNPTAITDSTFEAYRDAIVEQTRRLIFVAVQNLNEGAPVVPVAP